MPQYKVKLIDKKQVAENTTLYIFEKPQGFNYLPGQHIVVKLDIPSAPAQDTLRTFTLCSSPTEGNIKVVMRDGISVFKKTLQNMSIGTEITIIGPAGRFTLQEGKNIVMIAGGIGIAPFRSMIKYIFDKNLSYNIILLYSNPTQKRIAFYNEFKDIFVSQSNPNLTIINTLTQEIPESWREEQGRIDKNFIQKYVPDFDKRDFYICGPPKMVEDIEKILLSSLNINPKNIFTEKFTGY